MNYSGIIALVIYIVALIVYIKYDATHSDEQEPETKEVKVNRVSSPLDLNDEDATVASLIAAIECRNEYKKNVQVISIRKVN